MLLFCLCLLTLVAVAFHVYLMNRMNNVAWWLFWVNSFRLCSVVIAVAYWFVGLVHNVNIQKTFILHCFSYDLSLFSRPSWFTAKNLIFFLLWRPYTRCDPPSHMRPNREQQVAFTIKIAWEINRNESCLAGGDVENNTRIKSSGSGVSVGREWQGKMPSSFIDLIWFDSHSHEDVRVVKLSFWCLTLLATELDLLAHLEWSR